METAVQQFLLKLPNEKREPAMFIRELVLSANKEITDSIKWRQLAFSYKKTSFAFVYTYATVNYINLGFFKAVELSDPQNLFEGTGKGMRHIKIRTIKEIPIAQVKKWVKEAISLLQVK